MNSCTMIKHWSLDTITRDPRFAIQTLETELFPCFLKFWNTKYEIKLKRFIIIMNVNLKRLMRKPKYYMKKSSAKKGQWIES